MENTRHRLHLYCIEKRISMSKISKGCADNPFPVGESNLYKFYLGKINLSARQLKKLELFFELENYTK